MNEITVNVERDEDSGALVASWDDPAGGGLSTQGRDLAELQTNVIEAVRCHFASQSMPRVVRLHFAEDPVLVEA